MQNQINYVYNTRGSMPQSIHLSLLEPKILCILYRYSYRHIYISFRFHIFRIKFIWWYENLFVIYNDGEWYDVRISLAQTLEMYTVLLRCKLYHSQLSETLHHRCLFVHTFSSVELECCDWLLGKIDTRQMEELRRDWLNYGSDRERRDCRYCRTRDMLCLVGPW